MATLRRLLEKTIELNEIITTTTSEVIDLDGAQSISVQCVVDVTTPAAKQFDSGESQVTTITFDTKANTSAGDYVVIYDTAGLAWAVAADLDGDDAEPTGATWVSIPASRKAQVNLSAATSAAEVAAAFETAF